MTLVYQIITLALSIIIYPWLKINKKTAPFLSQRYGSNPVPIGEYYWFHGASLGEIQGLVPLIKLLRAEKPKAQILGTATSVKGYQQMMEIADFASLLPIDHPIYLNKFLAHATIKKFIFGETEIWPSLIDHLTKCKVSCYLVNGRLSEFNLKKYLFFKNFFKRSLNKLVAITCISKIYQERFLELGAKPEQVQVTGNLKYDQSGELMNPVSAKILEAKIFNKKLPVFTIASIRPDEELFFSEILQNYPGKFNIIIAPRHPEKFNYFKKYLLNLDLDFKLKSELNQPTDSNLVLLDTLGELSQVYSFTKVSFIGGSLIPGIGGHNPMEAAPYQNIILIGPEHQNQIDCVSELQKNKAIFVVNSSTEISEILDNYLELEDYGANAKETWLSFQNKSKLVFGMIFADA